MKNKELDELEQEWNAISKMPEKSVGNKEAQKKVILTRCGISTLAPEGYNLSEPKLDENFGNYLQTQRASINADRNYKIALLTAIILAATLVAIVLIAVLAR